MDYKIVGSWYKIEKDKEWTRSTAGPTFNDYIENVLKVLRPLAQVSEPKQVRKGSKFYYSIATYSLNGYLTVVRKFKLVPIDD